ncbi:MAG: SRPBCC family protein [Polyangia bacterium]
MKRNGIVAACLLVLAFAPLTALAAEDTSLVETSAVIDAPIADVWRAFATAEGVKSWMAAQARVDLKVGGEMVTRYGKDGALGDDGSIVHRLLAFDPERLLVWKPVRAPKTFPFKEAWQRTTNLIYFQPLPDGKTRVVDRMIGYDGSDEAQKMRAFFTAGNRATFEALQKHFAH